MISKHKFYHCLIGLPIVCLLAACSGDSLFPAEKQEATAVPLSISGAGMGLAATTRAAEVELTGDKHIGLFVKQTTSYAAVNNRQFSYGDPEWIVEGAPILLSVDRATVAAYYPYAADVENPLNLMSGQLYAAAQDYCYTKFTADSKNASVVLSLKRVYALVRFRLAKFGGGKPYQQEGRVSAINFSLAGSIPTARLDMLNGVLLSAFPAASYTYGTETGFSQLLGTVGTPLEVAFLMVPATLKNDVSFTLMVDGKEMSGKVTVAELCGASSSLVAGTRYDIGITVYPTGLGIHADAQPWTEAPVDGAYEL